MSRSYNVVAAPTQRAIVADYRPGQRGKGMASLAAKYSLTKDIVRSVIKRAPLHEGDPVQPRGHKRRKLSAEEEHVLVEAAQSSDAPTLRSLAQSTGNKIGERTVANYLRRQSPPVTSKVPVKVDPKEENAEWKSSMRAFVKNTLRRIAQNNRVYQDETAIYANESRRKMRAPKGKRAVRAKVTYAKKYTLSVYATKTSVLHWELSDKNANDAEVARVAKAAVKKLKNGQVLLWDRLGRSGRARNPVKQHYNPEVIQRFNNIGVKVIHLPPLGKWLNPLELLFNDLKDHHILRGKFHTDGSSMSFEELKRIIRAYMRDAAPTRLPGFFRERASGRQAKNLGLL